MRAVKLVMMAAILSLAGEAAASKIPPITTQQVTVRITRAGLVKIDVPNTDGTAWDVTENQLLTIVEAVPEPEDSYPRRVLYFSLSTQKAIVGNHLKVEVSENPQVETYRESPEGPLLARQTGILVTVVPEISQ